MATADKLKKYVTDIANAIRAKEGSTEKINPQDFVQRIENLQVGGEGTDGGENTYEYIELTKPEGYEGEDFIGGVVTPLVMLCALLGKVEFNGSMVIMTPYMFGIQQLIPIAMAYDPNMLVQVGETGFMKVSEAFQMFGIPDLPRLTKEQFYTLE